MKDSNTADNGALQARRHSPLTCACQKGHTGIAQLLLSHKADIEAFNTDTVVHLTLILQSVPPLLNSKLRVQYASNVWQLYGKYRVMPRTYLQGLNALMYASEQGHLQTVTVLLQAGAAVSVVAQRTEVRSTCISGLDLFMQGTQLSVRAAVFCIECMQGVRLPF